MEWTQIAAWIVWAWVGFMTLFSMLGVFALFDKNFHQEDALIVAALSLNAILGLMLIQTLGLTV